jgi:hypothetical protein
VTCRHASILGILLAVAVPCRAGLSHEQIVDLFNQANQAFRIANTQPDAAGREPYYDKAILAYEKIIQDGSIHNAKLYYDLANAYLLKGDVGQAILNYRRAEQLDAGDRNIQKNLAFARSRRVDAIAAKTEQQVLETLLFWHYDLGIRSRILAACAALAAGCLGLTVMVWRPVRSLWVAVVVLSGIATVCLAISVGVDVLTKTGVRQGVITAAEVAARQGDGPNYPESFKAPLHSGTEFRLIEKRPGWLHIRLSDGSDTWIVDNAAALI